MGTKIEKMIEHMRGEISHTHRAAQAGEIPLRELESIYSQMADRMQYRGYVKRNPQ